MAENELLAPLDWYVSHIAGCLPSIAARLDTIYFGHTMIELSNQLVAYWFDRDFQGEVQKRMLRLGKQPPTKGGDDEKSW